MGEDNPVQENKDVVHEIEDEDCTEEEDTVLTPIDNKSVYSDNPFIEIIDADNDQESRVTDE